MLAVLPEGLPVELDREYFEKNPWPISDDEFFATFGTLLDSVVDVIKEAPPDVADVVLADIRFFLSLIDKAHISAATSLVGKALPHNAQDTLANAQEKDFATTFSADHNRSQLRGWAKAVYRAISHPAKFRDDCEASTFRECWMGFAFVARGFLGREKCVRLGASDMLDIGLGNPSDQLRRRYCEENNLSLLWVEDCLALSACRPETPPATSALDQIQRKIANLFKNLPAEYQERVDFESIRELWERRIRGLWIRYWAYRHVFRGISARVHLCGAGNTDRRLLALALQREGALVFSYNHGGNLHLSEQKYYFLFQEAPWSRIVCPSLEIARNMENTYRGVTLGKTFPDSQFRFTDTRGEESSSTSSASCLEDATSSAEFGDVLLIGFPVHGKRYLYGSGLFFHFRLDLELRLVDQLQALGRNVSYSVHPEYQGVVEPYFLGKDVQIVKESVESEAHRYRLLVFTDIASTAFGNAIKGEQEIVLLYNSSDSLLSDALNLLSQRVGLVPLAWSENNRLVFDEEDLIAAIGSSDQKKLATEFRHKYIGSIAA